MPIELTRRRLFEAGGWLASSALDAQKAAAAPLDLTRYEETFTEDFRGPLDVTPWGPSRWIAHTPWHGDFGDAVFSDPHDGSPFHTGPSGLEITAVKGGDGVWRSGLLSSVDEQGRGFSQIGGYFEARMKMPPGPGTWPGFWLVSHSDPLYHVEIDVVEYYGHGTSWYQVNLNLWPKAPGHPGGGHATTINVPAGSLVDDYHTFGAEVTDAAIVYYLDRQEVHRLATPPSALTPMSLLIDLAMGSGWPIDKAISPSVLKVDYIKAFKRRP